MKEVDTEAHERFQTGNAILVSLTHLLHDIYSSFLSPLRPLLIERFGISLSAASLWDLFQRIPWLLNPLIGIIAERAPARYFVIVTPAVTAAAMSLLGVAPSYTVISVLLLVMGVSSAVFHVPTPVMMQKVSGRQTGKGMSYYMFGGEVARTLGPLVITGAVSLWGLEGTWKLMPFGLAASLVLYFRLRKIRISGQFKKSSPSHGFRSAFIRLVPFFLLMTGITFFRAIMKSGLTAFLPTYYYHDQGETLWYANTALSLFQLAGAAGTLLAGAFSDRFGRKRSLMWMAVVTPLFMWLFMMVEGFWQLPVLMVLGVFIFAPGPVMLALVQDREKNKRVFANSIYMTISFFTAALSVVIAGVMGDWLGLETTFMISAFIALGAIPCVMMLKER
ncbi:MAG: MFS transporter [Bacteroidales bacterium]|nr:MFS transporter [Bacteroidales bacterium]